MAEQTVGDALRWGFSEISRSPSSTPRLDAELILGYVTGRSRTQLLAWPEYLLTPDMQSQFARLINARIDRSSGGLFDRQSRFHEPRSSRRTGRPGATTGN